MAVIRAGAPDGYRIGSPVTVVPVDRTARTPGSTWAGGGGETVSALKQAGAPLNRKNLSAYKRQLDQSFVMKDLKKYKDLPSFMHKNRHMFDVYPRLLNRATQTWFRVDGVDKLSKEREIMNSFRKDRGLPGLLGDAFKMMRVWR